MKLYICRNKTQ